MPEAEGEGTYDCQCDLASPACTPCIKASWPCPGYPDRFILAIPTTTTPSKPSKTVVLKIKPTPPKPPPEDAISTCTIDPFYTTNPNPLRPPRTLFSKGDFLRLAFLGKMESDDLAARLAMMPATHILKHIPQRIGLNRALDDAVGCIMQGPSTRDICKSSRLYVTALGSLRRALSDEKLVRAPETLAAASLLQMYEQYADLQGQSWILHARGVVKMLQAKGAGNLTDDIEKAVLEAQAGNVFMSALTAWRRVLRPTTDSGGQLNTFMSMVVDGVRFPGIDVLCASLVRQCEYDYLTPVRHRIMVGTAALSDMLRMREQLGAQFGRDQVQNIDCDADPIRIAAYAATGFFVITTNTILLGLCKQLTAMSPNHAPRLPDGVTEAVLKTEREAALERVTARFKLLATVDPRVRFTAPAALRIILATVLGIGGPTSSEAATLLFVLDQGLEDVPGAFGQRCQMGGGVGEGGLSYSRQEPYLVEGVV
ncbi:hypothetical protein LTR56_021789 [Elasticomyces elasticus]|nr:hypothetical protein LTR56_021789 [Elasticomyces elasticus]KAK3630545.1 hypothetical protein LTR22_021461 [Elasticomyces elasticus]KAK5748465.1 hypothetical protein LTS12_021484 [Elasticomyces elasticus]